MASETEPPGRAAVNASSIDTPIRRPARPRPRAVAPARAPAGDDARGAGGVRRARRRARRWRAGRRRRAGRAGVRRRRSRCVLAVGALVWAFWPLRRVPSDAQVARFIEERAPSLDDRLVERGRRRVERATQERAGARRADDRPTPARARTRRSIPTAIVPSRAACGAPDSRRRRPCSLLAASCCSAARHRRGRRSMPRRSTLFPVARRARGDAGQRAHQGRLAARRSRRGWSATARRSSRSCCSDGRRRDDWRASEMTDGDAARFALVARAVAGVVQLPRRRRHGRRRRPTTSRSRVRRA